MWAVVTPTAGGCYTTTGAITSSKKYTVVNPLVTYSVNMTPDADTVCKGTSSTLIHLFSNSASAAWTQEWHQIDPSGANTVVYTTSSSTNTNYTPSTSLVAGNYKYYVKLSSSTPACGVTFPIYSDTANHKIDTSYTPSLATPTASAASVCV